MLLDRSAIRLVSKCISLGLMSKPGVIRETDSPGVVERVPVLISYIYICRPQIRQDYPLNLSISISGGKETNKDSPSNGE